MDQYEVNDRTDFIIGNLFPDIRYLGSVSREDTHEQAPTAKKVRECSSSFQSGVILHSYVDEMREKFLRKEGIYDEIAALSPDFTVIFLKLLEDEILYDRVPALSTIEDLNHLCQEEIRDGITEVDIQKWHRILQDYFTLPPSSMLCLLSFDGGDLKGIPPHLLREWSLMLPVLAENPRWIQYVEDLSAFLKEAFGREAG
jgi:hypothetical protein